MHETPFPASPYVAGPGIVSVLPGEAIHLAATVQTDGALADLRVVEEAEGDLHVEFKQDAPGSAMLIVHNDWERPLNYCAVMQLAGQTDLVQTTTVPVGAKISAAEMWSDPIVQLVLHKFRLVAPGEAHGCR